MDFDKDALSYQSKKKKNKQDEPEKLLDQSLEEFSVQDHQYVSEFDGASSRYNKSKRPKKHGDDTNYLNDILNLNRTR